MSSRDRSGGCRAPRAVHPPRDGPADRDREERALHQHVLGGRDARRAVLRRAAPARRARRGRTATGSCSARATAPSACTRCLADLGYFPAAGSTSYTRLGSPLGDHPDMRRVPGIDFSLGLARPRPVDRRRHGCRGALRGLDHRVFVLLGDGELNEGQVWEAAMAAAHFGLGNLVAIVDRNGMGLDGTPSEVMGIEPIADKCGAFGWRVERARRPRRGGALRRVRRAAAARRRSPTVLIARTVKGKGVGYMESDPDVAPRLPGARGRGRDARRDRGRDASG